MSDEGPTYGLVMPFLPVASKGGPYEDRAYAAGYEMGLLDHELGHTAARRVRVTLHRANLTQADLLAMRHAWRPEFVATNDGEWVEVVFERWPLSEVLGPGPGAAPG